MSDQLKTYLETAREIKNANFEGTTPGYVSRSATAECWIEGGGHSGFFTAGALNENFKFGGKQLLAAKGGDASLDASIDIRITETFGPGEWGYTP